MLREELKVFIFTPGISPYYVSVFEHLKESLSKLRIFVCKRQFPFRDWRPGWGNLAVSVQRCWSYWANWEHERGFSEKVWRLLPYDTLLILLRERPDIVISLQLGFRTLQAVIYRIMFRQSRLIIWTGTSDHAETGLPVWRVALRKALLSRADAVSANGAAARRYLRILGVTPAKTFTLPFGTIVQPLLEISLARAPEIDRRFLFVGQLIPRKGLEPFLEVLSAWLADNPRSSCEFWIAGRGLLRKSLEKFPVNPRMRLKFVGRVWSDELQDIYRQGGIFVFPTLADEWGLPVNEAMVSGLPVLGSLYAQAVEELVEDGVNGWKFRPDYPAETYQAVNRAMNVTSKQLLEMRRAARERAQVLKPEYGSECLLAGVDMAQSADTVEFKMKMASERQEGNG
jgi:glycosyltransferase involved in cell wall biosynthesis